MTQLYLAILYQPALIAILAAYPGDVGVSSNAPTQLTPAAMAASELPGPRSTQTALPREPGEAEVRGVIVAERSAARYRIREQLAGLQFPNDAVGETKEVSGTVALTSDGKVIAEQSRIVVDLRNLTSDELRRDRYIKRNTLETDRFPTVTFVLREVRGLYWPPPARGDASFKLVGDLTVQDQTRTVIWDTTAKFAPAEITGTAKTAFKFSEFGLTKPRVLSVLSVEDTIRLELDFTVSRSR